MALDINTGYSSTFDAFMPLGGNGKIENNRLFATRVLNHHPRREGDCEAVGNSAMSAAGFGADEL